MARRAGRKRRTGKRQPNGRLAPEKKPDDRIRTSRQPHRRKVPAEHRLDERAATPLGRLALKGKISQEEHVAGERFAFLVGEYRATLEVPRSTAGSGRGLGCLAMRYGTQDACRKDPEGCSCLQRKERYDAAYEALIGAVWRPPIEVLLDLDQRSPQLVKAIARAEAADGYQALPRQDQLAARAVNQVAVNDHDPTPQDFVHLVRGLRALARHFGLTGPRRREHRQNAN